jgi:putative hydrolase of HD superfamily
MSHRRQMIEAMIAAEGVGIIHTPDSEVELTTDALMHLADLAMAFGKIDRTACYHPDQKTKESDSDHTVMLGWLACAIATRWFPELDVGLIAQLALVHDAVEVYAGDTQTLRISPEERLIKKDREARAAERLSVEFGGVLPWFPALVVSYEDRASPEARFVWALDKSLPKIVHLLDGMAGLREFGITKAELERTLAEQTETVAKYARRFEMLMEIRAELTRRLLTHPNWRPDGLIRRAER